MDTILHAIWRHVEEHGGETALMVKKDGRYRPITWSEFGSRLDSIARALAERGLKPGDRIAIQSQTCPQWTEADLAATLSGLIVVPIYPQLSPTDCQYILKHAGVRFLFCEDEGQIAKVHAVWKELDDLEGAALFSGKINGDDRLTRFNDLVNRGQELQDNGSLIKARLQGVKPDDPMTIVYTSGTTGPPKGTVLANRGFLFNAESVGPMLGFKPGDRTVAYLPLAHVFERFAQYAALKNRVAYCYAESLETLGDNLREIRPHIMPGVPRVYEKAYAGILRKMAEGSPVKRALAHWALGVGRAAFDAEEAGRPAGFLLASQRALADRLVFSKIRAALGGCLRAAVVAAAPVPYEVLAFFRAAKVPMVEGYGLTETTAPTTLNPTTATRAGTAGPPFPGVTLKLAEDGEIMIKGPNLFVGYFHNEEATNACMTADGFFCTGDLGEIDELGYLKIVGRKKDIIINAYGKNIAARNVEDVFMADPLFAACVVCGDNKKYLTAVLSLATDSLLAWAAGAGMGDKSAAELANTAEVRELVAKKVEALNTGLAKFERVQKFVLTDHEFSVETGEITPTLKVKRKAILERFKSELDALYGD